MRVLVRRMENQPIELEVESNWTVLRLKEHIHLKIGVAVEHQRLIVMGRALKDDKPLSEYGIVEGHTIHLVERPPQPAASQPQETNTNTNTNANPFQGQSFSFTGGGGPGEMGDIGQWIQNIVGSVAGGAARAGQPGVHTQTTDGNGVRTTSFTTSTSTNIPQANQQPGSGQGPQVQAQAFSFGIPQTSQPQQQQQQQQQGEQPAQAAAQPHAALRFGLPQQVPQQPQVGVHVVVHATPADLDTLPERIAAFQNNLAQNGTTNVTVQQATPQTQPSPSPLSTQGLGQGIGMIINQTLRQGAAQLASLQRGQEGAVPTTAATTTTPPPPAASASASPSQMSAKNLVKELFSKVTTKIPLPMLLQVLGGNISCFDVLEDDTVEAIMTQFDHRDTPENRAALTNEFSTEINARMTSEGISQQLASVSKSPEAHQSIITDTQAIVKLHARRVLDVILDRENRHGNSFSNAVCSALKNLVGHFLERIQKYCKGGLSDALELCDLLFRSGSSSPMMTMLGPQFIKDVCEKAFRSYNHGETDDAAANLQFLPPVENSHLSCLTPGEQVRLGQIENIDVPQNIEFLGLFNQQ
eukprot:TRINITY_DN7725_c1_g2_i1.p1 TRINITY_DN7725_c1_g2~~TRINITY_DN7725_c1_g2_i1.p1  ORF type:complete len:584 (+),score=141.80 TRINITY_DN7725_c1_g2_i1:86-1837(+)